MENKKNVESCMDTANNKPDPMCPSTHDDNFKPMTIEQKNFLCFHAWTSRNPEFAGTVLRSKRATEEDGKILINLINVRGEEGVEDAFAALSNIEHTKTTLYGEDISR